MKRTLMAGLFVLLLALPVGAQLSSPTRRISSGPTLPSACQVGNVFFKTTAPIGTHECRSANTWSAPGAASSFTGGGFTVVLTGPNGTATAPAYSFTGATNTGMFNVSGSPAFSAAGTNVLQLSAASISLMQSGTCLTLYDAKVCRDAANIIAQRNAGSAATPVRQGLRLYNFCEGANCATGYERVGIVWASDNSLYISNEGAGTGVVRPMFLNGSTLNLMSGGTVQWRVGTTGSLQTASSKVLGWTAGADATAAMDTGLVRSAAATVCAGNGTAANCSGTFQARDLNLTRSITVTSDSDAPSGTFRRNSAAQSSYIVQAQTEANAFLAGIDKSGNMNITGQYQINGTRLVFSDLGAGNIPIGAYYVDMAEIAAPVNPAAGSCRFYVDSTTHQITFKNSSGGSCIAAGGSTSYPGVTSDGSNGLTVTGAVAAASLKAGAGTYVFTAAGANAAGVIHDDGSGNMTSSKVTSADVDTSVGKVIASGTANLPTTSIAANGGCASEVTATATGATAATDRLNYTPSADWHLITGYTPGGTLRIYHWITANTVHFLVCNGDATNAVTPGAASIVWGVTR